MKKEEILNLIEQDIDKAFKELDKVFLNKNASYMDLSKEYYQQQNNFSLANFRSKLYRFTSINYPEIESKSRNNCLDIDFYDLLCDIDFKPQSTYFKNIFHKKNVSAVLLHGENDEDGNDLKWLYHQLLKTESLMVEPPIPIDFRGSANSCFEDVLKHLCNKFELPFNSELNKIRKKIEAYLETNNLVVIIKYTKNISDLSAFYNLFNDFFSFLHKNVDSDDNSLIFLIVENDTEGYKGNLNDDYFLWFEEENRMKYSKTVKDCRDVKIIDLAPVQNIEASEIEDWINRNLNYEEIYNAFSCYLGCAQCLLEEKSNRYHVIQKLYNVLKIDETKNPTQWLKY